MAACDARLIRTAQPRPGPRCPPGDSGREARDEDPDRPPGDSGRDARDEDPGRPPGDSGRDARDEDPGRPPGDSGRDARDEDPGRPPGDSGRDARDEDPGRPPGDADGQEDTDDSEQHVDYLGSKVAAFWTFLSKHWRKNRQIGMSIVLGTLFLGYCAYFGYALYYDFESNIALLVLTFLVAAFIGMRMLSDIIERATNNCWARIQGPCVRAWSYGRWVLLALILVGIIVLISLDAAKDPQRLVSLAGLVVYVVLGFLGSKHPVKVPWRLVLSGILLQFVFGLVILRWKAGNQAFGWIGEQFTTFLSYTDYGSKYLFGSVDDPDTFLKHDFVFQVMPVVISFASIVSLLYYLGALQWAIRKLGTVMEVVMGIGPAEAFVAAANTFLGPNTSVLTIATFLRDMTPSELHCVMTSGFATVSGSLLGAYTSFGVPPAHLISASVMSAPAALSVAKLLYPENRKSVLRNVKTITFPEPEEKSALEAFSAGAESAISIVVNIVANLIAFVAILYFLNATLAWLGERVGVVGLSFQLVCSYLFMPLAFLMGVEAADCFEVARLIGTKIFLTDIVGYMELGKLINNRKMGLHPTISPRSEVISTYALCGFANFGDVGICLGAIGAIVPERRGDMAQVALRSMVAGNMACFITACLAGFLYTA